MRAEVAVEGSLGGLAGNHRVIEDSPEADMRRMEAGAGAEERILNKAALNREEASRHEDDREWRMKR